MIDVHDSLLLLKWMSSFNLLLAVVSIVLMIVTRELQYQCVAVCMALFLGRALTVQ